jgi:SAM-dependent methyltransferase
MNVSDQVGGKDHARGGNPEVATHYYKKDFWSEENLKFAKPGFRLLKSARIVNKIAGDGECDLLDVGCGPAALMHFVRANISYYGIDIAIQEPAANLIEADLLESPIEFKGRKFDIVLAQGVFEYMGEFQEQKFAEVSKLLKKGGKFVVSYVNFGHRDREIYWPYSNVQSLSAFKESVTRYFNIDRSFPTSHNWAHSEPNRKFLKNTQLYINLNVPFISPKLAVEYFFICSAKGTSGVES